MSTKKGGKVQIQIDGDPKGAIKALEKVEEKFDKAEGSVDKSGREMADATEESSKSIESFLDEVIELLTKMADVAEKAGKRVEDSSDQMANEAEEAAKKIEKAFDTIDKAADNLLKTGAVLLGISGLITKVGSDAQETSNKFEVAFKKDAKAVEQWVKKTSEDMRVAQSSLKEYSSSYQLLLNPLDMVRAKAIEISTDYSKLAYDLSSLYNKPLERSFNALRSAMTFEFEPMRDFGALLSMAKVEQEALTSGMIKHKSELTDVIKQQAIHNIIMRETIDAQGDWVNTSEDVANQMRAIKEQAKKIGENLAEDILPVISDLLDATLKMLDLIDNLPDPVKRATVEFLLFGGALSLVAGGGLKVIGIFRETKKVIKDIIPAIKTLIGLTGPMGWLVAGIATAAIGFTALKAKASEANSEMENVKQNVGSLVQEYDKLSEKETLTNKEKERLIVLSRTLAKVFPESVKAIDEETGAFIINTEAILKNSRARNLESMADTIRNEIKAIEDQTKAIETQMETLQNLNDKKTGSSINDWVLDQSKQKALVESFKILDQAGIIESMGIENWNVDELLKINGSEEVRKQLRELGEEYEFLFDEQIKIILQESENNSKRVEQTEDLTAKVQELNQELEKKTILLEGIQKTLSGEMTFEDLNKLIESLNKPVEDTLVDDNSQYDQQLKAMAEGRIKSAKLTQEILQEQYDEYEKTQIERYKAFQEQLNQTNLEKARQNLENKKKADARKAELEQERLKAMAEGRVKNVELTKVLLEEEAKLEAEKEVRRQELRDEMNRLYREGQIKAAKEIQALLEEQEKKEKELATNKFNWEIEQGLISRDEYKTILEEKLQAAEEWSVEYIEILRKLGVLEDEENNEREERWKSFFDNISSLFSGIDINADFEGEQGKEEWIQGMSDQFSKNASGLASEALGKFADTFLPGLGSIVEQASNLLFDIFSEDNWEERFDGMLDAFDKGLENFVKLIFKIIDNLPSIMLKLAGHFGEFIVNIVLESLEWVINKLVDVVNWLIPFSDPLDHVDWGWDDDDPKTPGDGGNDDGDDGQKMTYGNITGPLADRFDQLIDALTNLDQLPGLFENFHLPVVNIRDDVAAIRQAIAKGEIPGTEKTEGKAHDAGETNIYMGDTVFEWDKVKGTSLETFFSNLIGEPPGGD